MIYQEGMSHFDWQYEKKINAYRLHCAHMGARDNEKAERTSQRGYYVLRPSFSHPSSVIVSEFIHVSIAVKPLLG